MILAEVALIGAELRRIRLPLVAPFRTSFGTQTEREALLVRVITSVGEGWGECVAMKDPLYSSEYVDGADHMIRNQLLPRLFRQPALTARGVGAALANVVGHRMAKAALEMAVLDAELRAQNVSFAQYLGVERQTIDCGVSVGIHDSVPSLLETVERHLSEGYKRIKLKIEPGWDVEPVRAVRERFGDQVPLQVDANTAYTLDDRDQLKRLDEFGLLLIEQPFPEEQVLAHAELARYIDTPVCLDESITSAQTVADAIALGACEVCNIKPGRVGGYLEAVRIHDLCKLQGVPVWCGGMLETGLGRGANIALAALPGFVLPGDVSASDRYYHRDITEPFVMHQGQLRVPNGPGLGANVIPAVLDEVTISAEDVRP
jgi:O-succinylbenzoate synthase